MLKCEDCGSIHIIHTEDYSAYFREGDFIRLRIIHVWNTTNELEKTYFASCSEISKSTITQGNSRLDAIKKLGETLKRIKYVELLGNKLDFTYE